MSHTLLIHGGGLAGCTAALIARQRGLSVALVHDPAKPDCSHAAAGMVSPVTGRYWSSREDTPTRRETALQHFHAAEEVLQTPLLAELQLVRRIRNPIDQERAEKRARGSGPAAAWFGDRWTADDYPAALDAPLGGFALNGAFRVDLSAYTTAVRAHLAATESLYTVDDPLPEATHHLWACGHYETRPAPTPEEWDPVRGETLRIALEGLPTDHAWHGETFLVPTAPDEFLAGATWGREPLDQGPTPEGREQLQTRLASWVNAPYTIAGHYAGVRPATRTRDPVAWIDPSQPATALLNGLGSRGALHAPFITHALFDQWNLPR